MVNKDFDVIVYGATSFVGKILCDYLVNEYAEPKLNWAMAARSEQKLQALQTALGDNAQNVPMLVADSFDEASLQALCDRTAVIISTVGPYALYGELLVKLCAESGTDYCDLTGEAQWIRRMISRYQSEAQRSGARIVHCCGFDSIPSDLGVKFLQEHALQRFGSCCNRVKMRVKGTRGGASGGTIASGINLVKEAAKDPALREELQDSYSLCPENHEFSLTQHSVDVEYDEDYSSWVGPFLMAAINTRIVLRSNALMQPPYGKEFRYDEATLTGDGRAGEKRAKCLARLSRVGMFALAVAPIRWIVIRFFLPKPGQGPSKEQQVNGYYDLRFFGSTPQGEELRIKLTGDRDPGYGSTAKMLAQAAISLCRDVDKDAIAGGFLTPATVFGPPIFKRLQEQAGMT
ncbi:MAG: saccharopine dehydrogenase NADP-binding domain-containing protein, partial [Gammaproteobacteria bacterium]|nr:saccharopine dehydrogenase NADP-binding domain-containing protein [Gammaproteobacteria bacterium]